MERRFRRDAPDWIVCDHCGTDDIEQTTFADCPADYLYDGDDFTCRECGLTGTGWADEDDSAGVTWSDDWPEGVSDT